MYDAKKLKRGQLFNVSITEVILLILFLLLLLFSIFYKELEKKYNELKNNNQDIAELMEELKDYRDTTGYTGPAQIKEELAELGPSIKDLKEALYMQKEKISELEDKIKELEAELEVLDSVKDLDKIEDLEQKIEDIAKFKEILQDANPEQVDELIEGMEKLLAEYDKDFDKLIEEIEDLAGNAIPKCWPTTYPDLNGKKAERLFTIRLQPKGIWVEPDFNERFNKEYEYLNIDENYYRVPLSDSTFLEAFKSLFDLSNKENPSALSVTEQRRCRHEVRIFVELPPLNDKYMNSREAIDSYFYSHRYRDENYCEYRKKYRNDNMCINK